MRYAVYTIRGEHIATTKFPEDAASMMSLPGMSVRDAETGETLWVEGLEELPAQESYDHAAEIMARRIGR